MFSIYVWIGMYVCAKSSGVALGLANARPHAAQNMLIPHPREWQGMQTPRSCPGSAWAHLRWRSNSIPWCTSFHVKLSLRTWHIIISNLQHAPNTHRSDRCRWFQTCFGSAASAFEIIQLAYIHYALKENFSITLTKKGFTCVSLICRELPLVCFVVL